MLCAQEVIGQSPDAMGVEKPLATAPVAGDWKSVPYRDSLTLALPPLTSRGTISHYPYWGSFFSGYSDWELHRGLNASLSASAVWAFGRHSGSGFANSVSLMYANNMTPKLSFAVGGYYSTFSWGGSRYGDTGLTAMLNYRFDEHWEAAAFVQKSVAQPKLPPHLYWLSDAGDRIGASVRYQFNPSFSVSLSVWNETRPGGFRDGYFPSDPFWNH